MNRRILLLVPRISLMGGIANYYTALKPFLPSYIHYFTRGSRGFKNKIVRVTIFIYDIIRFTIYLTFTATSLVIINTSIAVSGLKRDYVYIKIAKGWFKKKVIVFFHGWNENLVASYINSTPEWFASTFLKSDKIIVLANEFKDQIKALGYTNSIIVETTTVDVDLLSFPVKKIKNNQFSVLFLARIEKDKGIYDLLDAFEILHSKGLYIRLDIAGKGTELANVKRFVQKKKLKNVFFHGYIQGNEKARIYKNASVYLFPSYHEGMPISILEALAFGLPVLTTKVGGIYDFFLDGKMGYYIEMKNPLSIVNKLLILYYAPSLIKEMGGVNREYAINRFFSDKVAQRMTDHFRLDES